MRNINHPVMMVAKAHKPPMSLRCRDAACGYHLIMDWFIARPQRYVGNDRTRSKVRLVISFTMTRGYASCKVSHKAGSSAAPLDQDRSLGPRCQYLRLSDCRLDD